MAYTNDLLALLQQLSTLSDPKKLIEQFITNARTILSAPEIALLLNQTETHHPCIPINIRDGQNAYISYPAQWDQTEITRAESFKNAVKLLQILLKQVENENFKQNNSEAIREAFETQNNIFRNALDRIHAYVYLKDTDGSYTYANSHTLELFKCTAEELIGKTDFDFFPPEFARTLRKIDQTVMQNGYDTEKELETVNEHGEKIYYLEVKTPIFSLNEPNKVIGICGISTDITWQKKTAIELEHSHYLLKYIIEHNRSSVAVFDRHMNYIYVSQHYLNDFNLSSTSDIIGKNHYQLFPYLPEHFSEAHQRAMQGEVLAGNNNQLVHPDGSISWKQWECRPWYASDGGIGGIVLYTEDITERKQAEAALQESEEKYRSFFENSLDAILITKPDGKILSANQAACQMFQRSEEMLCNLGRESIVDIDDPRLPVLLAKRERDGKITGELNFKRSDGSIFPGEISSSIFLNSKGEKTTSMIIRDISSRVRDRQEIKENQRQLSSMISNLPGFVYRCKNDENWTMLYISEACISVTGYLPDDFINNKKIAFKQIIKEEYHDILSGEWELCLKDKKLFQKEYQIINANNELVWVLERGSGIFDQHNQLLFLEGYIEDISERKAAEIKLRESEQNYRELIDGMNETVWVIDFNGNLLDVNETAIRTMGYSKEELLEIGLYGIDASLKKEMIVALAKSMPVDELQIFETTHLTKSGEIIPVEVYSSLVSYLGQKAILSIARNISKRKKMEKQLRESEETIRLLFNSTAEGIYGINTEGICTFCNKAALKMLGYNIEEEVIGQKIHDLIHHSHPDHSAYPGSDCTINNAFKRKKGIHSDTEVFWRRDGSSIPVEFWSFPIERDAKIIGAVVTFVDISQRKHDEEVQQILHEIARTSMSANAIEEMLGVVRMELSKVIDTTNFYVALHNPEKQTLRKIIYINEKQTLEEWSIHNTLSGEVLRSKKSILLKAKDIKDLRKKGINNQFAEKVKCWLGVPLIENKLAIGVMVVQSYTNEQAYNKGHARFLEMIAHELTIVVQRNRIIQDLIKAKEKAEESDRLKSSFLANLSHEIRTPMNSIMGFASLLPDEEDSALIYQYADIIVRNSEQLVHIIDDIVLYSRLQTRLLSFSPSEFNADTLFNDIVQSFRLPEFTEKVTLQIDPLCDGKLSIHSDYEKLRQVITNLIFNAFKYTPSGSITLGIVREESHFKFYVRDTGIGIPEKEIDKIFERFYRASNVDKGAISGTGLGLSIVKELIELAGGNIWVESVAGNGSTFYFTIPN